MNKHTKVWLDNQALWREKDVALIVSVAIIIGFITGWLVK